MTNVFTCLMKKKFGNGNGSGMDRESIGNGSARMGLHNRALAAKTSRKLFAVLFCLLFVGVGNAWGTTYTITFFKANTGDGSGITGGSTACSTIVSDGSSYLSGNVVTATKANYNGSGGLKLGTSSSAGTLKMNLASSITNPNVWVRAKRYNSGTNATINVNSQTAQATTSEWVYFLFSLTGTVSYIQLDASKYLWVQSITVSDEWDGYTYVDVKDGNDVYLPSGSSTYTTKDWGNHGAPTKYKDTTCLIGPNGYSVYFKNSSETSNENGLQCQASGGTVQIPNIKSYSGIDVEIVCSGDNGFKIELTEASDKTDQTGTSLSPVTISTSSNNATLAITKNTSSPGYIQTIKISPKDPAPPTSTTNSSIVYNGFTAGWTAPTSAPDNGYLVAYSSATSTAPGSNVTATTGNYTVVSSASASKAISSLTAGTTYHWWVRSKFSSTVYSDWVAGPDITIPKITVSPSSITGLNYEVGSGPSTSQSFSVSGVGLTGNLTVTAPTNFEVSKDNSSFAASQTITASGTLSATTIYVRLKSSLSVNTYGASNVAVSGGGASTVNVSVTGRVIPLLDHIAVTTAPTKTVYIDGETFDKTGMVVTATYSDETTEDVTSSCTFTPSPLTGGTTSVTATYGVKTTTQSVTVYAVTIQAKDEDNNAIAVGGPGTPTRSGTSISPAADAANYVFKQWNITGASLGSSATTKSNTITTPTGAITVTAVYYKPITIAWMVNGENVAAGSQTLSVGYGTLWSALTAPSTPANNTLDCADTFMGWSNSISAGTEWYENEAHSAPGTLVKDFSAVSTSITAPITFKAVFATHVDGLANKTIIEDFEKQTAISTYNSTQTYSTSDSNVGIAWSMYYGCVSTESKIKGNNSAQMRWYSSATSNLGYVKSTTALLSLSSLKFRAKVSDTNVKMDVAYSTDGSSWTNVGSGVTLTTNSKEYSYSIPGASATNYYIKIGISSSGTAPTSSTYKFTIDSIAVTYKAPSVTYENYSTKCCTALEDVNEAITWPSSGTAEISWDDSEHASSWVVKYRTGSAAYGTDNVSGQTTSDGRRKVTVSSLTCGTEYDFKIIPTPITSYKASDIDIEDVRAHGHAITLYNSGTIVDEDVTLGTFDADGVSDQCAGEDILLTAYRNPGYVIDEWVITKTSNGEDITDADGIITYGVKTDEAIIVTQPAYPITVKATFKEDPTPRIALSQTSTYAFSTVNQYTSPSGFTFTVNAAYLDSDVKIELSGTGAAGFSLDKSSITPTEGRLTDAEVTVTPVTTTAGTFSATVDVYDEDLDADPQSFNVTLTVTPVYDITWKVNGEALTGDDLGSASTRVVTGSSVSTLPPDPADNSLNSCANTFIGWTDATNGNYTHGTSSLYDDAGDFPNISGATTYYAVFAESVAARNYTWTLDYTDDGVKDSTFAYGTALDVTARDGGEWVVKASKSSGMLVNTDRDCSIKIPTCKENIKTIVITCGAAKAVGFSTSNYSGEEEITYQVSGSDATSQTLDFSGKSLKSGYIVPKGGATAITRIVVTYGTPAYVENYVTQCDGTTARVTYAANGGTGMICADGVYAKDGFKTCDTPPTKKGHTFLGWNDGSSNTAANTAYTLTTDVDFTAAWSIINYTITYHLDGGTNDGDNPATYTVDDSDITLKSPTRSSGHDRFDGWYDNEEFTGSPVTTIESGSTGNREYWAKWATRHHIEFYKEDTRVAELWRAEDEDISTAVAGQGIAPLHQSTPTLCGTKDFTGWTESEILFETDTKPSDLMLWASGKVDEDKVYHAVWSFAPPAYNPGDEGTYVLAAYNTSDEKWYAIPTSPTVTSGKITGAVITVSNVNGINYVTSTNASGYCWGIANTTYGQTISDGSHALYHSNGGASGTNLTYGDATDYSWVIAADGDKLLFQGAVIESATTNVRGLLMNDNTFGGYALSNKDGSGYYRVQVLPVHAGTASPAYATYCYNTFTDDAVADHNWSTMGNWSSGSIPTASERVLIQKPVTVDVVNAKAKEVILDQRTGNTGKLEISAGKALVVDRNVRKTTDGTTMSATAEEDIVIGSTLAAGTGALVMGGHDGTNKATVNFAVKAKKDGSGHWINQFIGTPFNDETAVLYNYYGTQVYQFCAAHNGTYGGSGSDWTKLTGSDGMTPFMGYNLLRSKTDDHVLWMQGTLNRTDQNKELALVKNDGEDKTENMFANSWMAPIHIDAFSKNGSDFGGADATIYIFNAGTPEDQEAAGAGAANATAAGQYIVLPVASAPWTSPTVTVIPAMQAFSVYSTAADQTLTLDYNKLVYTPALTSVGVVPTRAPRRAAREAEAEDESPEVIRLHVQAASGYAANAYVLGGLENFTEGFDNGWDGRFIAGDEEAPQLYIPSQDGNMAISCVPDIEGTVLGFRKGSEDSQYMFSFEYEGEENWYLNDLQKQESTQITDGNTYMFTSGIYDSEARFVISATPIHKISTGVDGVGDGTKARKLLIEDKLYIIRGGRMYSAEGALVK